MWTLSVSDPPERRVCSVYLGSLGPPLAGVVHM